VTMLSGHLVLGTLVLLTIAAAQGASDAAELVRNPDFATAGEGGLPAAWAAWTPVWKPAACRLQRTEDGLLVDAPDGRDAVGGVTQDLRGVEPGRAYAVEAVCELRGIASPLRSALVRLGWLKGKRPLHPAGRLVRGPVVEGAVATFRDIYVAPKEADGVRLSLEVKWPGTGSVLWKRVSVRPTDPPKPRKVKLGSVYLVPRRSTPEKNLDLWCAQIDAAGKLGLDIVCLGEAITMVGTGKTVADVAEPIPGPSTKRLGEAAKRNRLYVVAGLNEKAGEACYNTAVLLDREGKLVFAYRKVHLPREEWKQGITPGTDYPVYETDFGLVAIQICYDWFFPEAASAFALAGAEVLFAPTWGNTLPDSGGRVDGETTFRVRARDNGLVIVPSVYSGNSLIIDPLGRILASSAGREGVVWAEVDLAARERLDFVGHWRAIGPRDRMPATYAPLLRDPVSPPQPKHPQP